MQALTHPCSDATQTSGTATTNVSTRYTYDGAGNLASMIDAAGHTTTYGYDASGAPDRAGPTPTRACLVWKYDALGRQVRQENRTDAPMTASVTWTYDAAGRMLSRTADSITTTYTYDLSGNKLTASDGTLAITGTYDRDDRVLTVDDEDAGTTADTTYTYPTLLAPTRADVTGSYAFTLDKFDHATAVNDPVMASDFTTTYRADGQPELISRPDGNYTELDLRQARRRPRLGHRHERHAGCRHRPGRLCLDPQPGRADPDRGRDRHRRRLQRHRHLRLRPARAADELDPVGHDHELWLGCGPQPHERPGRRRHAGHHDLRRRRSPDVGCQPDREPTRTMPTAG